MGDHEILQSRLEDGLIYDPNALVCRLPTRSEREAQELLEIVGSGGALGSGYRMRTLGVEIPQIRTDYEQAVARLIQEVERRQAARVPREEIARWVVGERIAIARQMRMRQGVGPLVTFEIRDNLKYGLGGRSYANMERRYATRGFRGADLQRRLIEGATHPNAELSQSAIRGARYLRHGGRVVLVISIATTAYVLLTTPEDQLGRVISEEAGGAILGAAGTAAAVGLCLVFGIATAGWGLLACGAVGGLIGGAAGSLAGERIYYASTDDVVVQAQETGVIDASLLLNDPVCR